MIKIVRWLIWLMLSLLIVTLLDQTLTRVPLQVPGVEQFQEFYVDFRSRLFGIAGKEGQDASLEEIIETSDRKAPAVEQPKAPLYLYADEAGELHFADSLEDVPLDYRAEAQPMDP